MMSEEEHQSSSEPILRVIILDVGHGNCAIVQDAQEVAVIDAPKTLVLPKCLTMQKASTISRLVLSHADDDHIGGAQALLAHEGILVKELWINPNSRQHSRTYIDLLTAARDRYLSTGLKVHTNLNVGAEGLLSLESAQIQILHPDIIYAGVGPNAPGHPLGTITSNGMSAVLRVLLAEQPAVLLPGDMDAKAFEVIAASGANLRAPVLVFPHHGGGAGTKNDGQFAAALCEAVQPDLVVFSIGRRRYSNPNPEIIAGIRSSVPKAHIACTQLSRHCHQLDLQNSVLGHVLLDLPAAGAESGISCAGSIVVEWSAAGLRYRPLRASHQKFIKTHISTPLCNRGSAELALTTATREATRRAGGQRGRPVRRDNS
jgi:beta-lactamase superfamily II metal-dependent hydrolase